MISALLVDDEPRANEMMRKLLAAHAEIEIVGVAENAAEARGFFEATSTCPGTAALTFW